MKKTLLVLSALLLGITANIASALEIPITVTEPAGVDRVACPVSGGIPVPAGQLDRDQPFALFDGNTEVPVQVSPLVVDQAGKLRWILLDFEADLKAGQSRTLVLKAASPSAKPATPLVCRMTEDAVEIKTGRAAFEISRKAPSIIGAAHITYTDGLNGTTYEALAPEIVENEYNGPIRATVKLAGRFKGDDQNKFQWIARVTAWAGQSAVHVKYSLANSNPDHYAWRTVADSTVELTLPAVASDVVLGAGKPVDAGASGWLHQGLRPNAAGNAKAGRGDEVLWTSAGGRDQAQGWLRFKAGDVHVAVADLYFEDDPARRLAVDGNKLRLTGVAQRFQVPEDGDKRGLPYGGEHRFLPDCTHLSSEYVVDLAAGADPAAVGAAVRGWREMPSPFVSPEYYLHDENAMPFGLYATQADEIAANKAWELKFDPAKAPKTPARGFGRVLGNIDNHYTPEEDVLEQLLIMYLRTGQRSYYQAARTNANYQMDLYAWRTDGWRWKDGGIWWYSGPKGSHPQRVVDPVSGNRNHIYNTWAKEFKEPWDKAMAMDGQAVTSSKSCNCHNWAAGLFEWYLLTGDRDALEAGIDRVEQDYDSFSRAFKLTPGKAYGFSRNFTRASYNAHAGRFTVPGDEFLTQASEYFFAAYNQRPNPEPRGLVNGPDLNLYKILGGQLYKSDDDKAKLAQFEKYLEDKAGKQGVEAFHKLGVTVDWKAGKLVDKAGNKWEPIDTPHTWMYPPLSRAMELYYRMTGNEDARDWTVAYGQAAGRLLLQRHGTLHYGKMLGDFPARGVFKDWLAWVTDEDNKWGEGVSSSGFLARFHPDVCGRAYTLTGEEILRETARRFWEGGSHRGYNTTKIVPIDEVARWINYVSDHDGQVEYVGRTFYHWANPRTDAEPPAAVRDLTVVRDGDSVTVTFTVPADASVVQVKCAKSPIVDYATYVERFNSFKEQDCTNWWMAHNVAGEPATQPGRKVAFKVKSPAEAAFFAVRTFDSSNNRSAISNIAEAR